MRRRILIAQVVNYAPRSHGLRRHKTQDVPRRCLQITVKVRFLVAHQRGEIFPKPVGVFIHVGVNAQLHSGFGRLEGDITFIFKGDLQGRLSLPRDVAHATLHVVDCGAVREVTVRNPFCHCFTTIPLHIKGRPDVALSLPEEGDSVIALIHS